MKNKTHDLADLFCGAGGTSTGALQAAKELGIDVRLVAVNHWEIAISTHSKNHPVVPKVLQVSRHTGADRQTDR